jgi:hypothetical protein
LQNSKALLNNANHANNGGDSTCMFKSLLDDIENRIIIIDSDSEIIIDDSDCEDHHHQQQQHHNVNQINKKSPPTTSNVNKYIDPSRIRLFKSYVKLVQLSPELCQRYGQKYDQNMAQQQQQKLKSQPQQTRRKRRTTKKPDSTNVNNNNNLNTITLVNTVKSLNENYKPPETTTTATSSPPPSVALLPSLTSPAELLRKCSNSTGYVSEMDALFKGSSITVTQCLSCESMRSSPEAFYDRSIPLDDHHYDDDDDDKDWISKCLSNESYLNGNSKYMCDICVSKQEAKIHTRYTHMPNVLILHLLSYGVVTSSSLSGHLSATQKLSNRSSLVNCFNFTSCVNDQHRFRLFAVVMHSGPSLNSGHYTAFVNYKAIAQMNHDQNDNDDQNDCSCMIDCWSSSSSSQFEWLHFDDTKCRPLSNEEFHRKIQNESFDSPYILFYVKDDS